jgi:transcriptional regulator with XRE-family HTH domain
MSEPNERLNEAMRVRRLELGIRTWKDLAQRAGISYETMRSLRAGAHTPTGATIHGLNQALGWEDGAGIEALLEDGEPTPAGLAEAAKPSLEKQLAELAATVTSLQEQLDKLTAGERNSRAS